MYSPPNFCFFLQSWPDISSHHYSLTLQISWLKSQASFVCFHAVPSSNSCISLMIQHCIQSLFYWWTSLGCFQFGLWWIVFVHVFDKSQYTVLSCTHKEQICGVRGIVRAQHLWRHCPFPKGDSPTSNSTFYKWVLDALSLLTFDVFKFFVIMPVFKYYLFWLMCNNNSCGYILHSLVT